MFSFKLTGVIILEQYIMREKNMSKKDHFGASFQLTSAENGKAYVAPLHIHFPF